MSINTQELETGFLFFNGMLLGGYLLNEIGFELAIALNIISFGTLLYLGASSEEEVR